MNSIFVYLPTLSNTASGGQVRDDRRGTVDPKRRSSKGRYSQGGGDMKSRWEAPPASNSSNNNEGSHYGPSSGNKRGRSDSLDDYDSGRAAKNSRFDDD